MYETGEREREREREREKDVQMRHRRENFTRLSAFCSEYVYNFNGVLSS